MGLDINFFKGKRSAYAQYQEKRARWEESEDENDDNHPYIDDFLSKCGCFRKVNFLVAFFDYEENGSLQEVDYDELEELLWNCNKVLRYHDDESSEEFLPTCSGFFFGGTEYDESYYEDVEKVRNWVDELLPTISDDDVVVMHCSW